MMRAHYNENFWEFTLCVAYISGNAERAGSYAHVTHWCWWNLVYISIDIFLYLRKGMIKQKKTHKIQNSFYTTAILGKN